MPIIFIRGFCDHEAVCLFAGFIRELPDYLKGVIRMGNLKKGLLSSNRVNILAVLGSVASIVGLILAIVFRIQDRKNHKMKESNRPSAKE